MATRDNRVTTTKRRQHTTNRVFVWIVIGVVLSGFLSFQIWQNVSSQRMLKEQLAQAEQEYSQIQVQKSELEEQIRLLNDNDYILKLARSHGFYSASNEIIFNLPIDNNLLKQNQTNNN